MKWEEIIKMTPEESSKKYLEITNNFMKTFTELEIKFDNMETQMDIKNESSVMQYMKDINNLLKELKPKLDEYIEELDFQLEGR